MTPKAQSSLPALRFTLEEIARHTGGQAEGDSGFVVSGVAGIDDAGPGDVTFAEGARHVALAAAGRAGAVFVPAGIELPGRNLVRVQRPRVAFAEALALFHPVPSYPAGIHPSAVVEPDAEVDPTASVGALCFVGARARIGARAVLRPLSHVGADSVVGAGTLLYPGAILLDRVTLGERVTVYAGAVVGSDGFGFVFDGREHRKILQVGTVVIGDDVEIGSGTMVDRATTGVTSIGRGTKVDNLVQIAHNVSIGERVIIAGQSGIAGSSRIGDGAVLGARAGVADHATVGAGARVAGMTSVMNLVAPGTTVAGFGPQLHRDFLKSQAVFEQLPQLRKRLAEVERRLAAAEAAAGIQNEPGRQ